MRGELETKQNCDILTPTLMAITAFLSRSPGQLNWRPGDPALSGTRSSFQHLLSNWSGLQLLDRGSWGPPLLGAGSLYKHLISDWSDLQLIWSPTDLNFLSLGLYNNLTPTLLSASVIISYSTQLVHGQGYILIFLNRMHLLFTQVHFLFWTAWSGSICYNSSKSCLLLAL